MGGISWSQPAQDRALQAKRHIAVRPFAHPLVSAAATVQHVEGLEAGRTMDLTMYRVGPPDYASPKKCIRGCRGREFPASFSGLRQR
jgi:hypothetical protein